jgi:hypothetical protein
LLALAEAEKARQQAEEAAKAARAEARRRKREYGARVTRDPEWRRRLAAARASNDDQEEAWAEAKGLPLPGKDAVLGRRRAQVGPRLCLGAASISIYRAKIVSIVGSGGGGGRTHVWGSWRSSAPMRRALAPVYCRFGGERRAAGRRRSRPVPRRGGSAGRLRAGWTAGRDRRWASYHRRASHHLHKHAVAFNTTATTNTQSYTRKYMRALCLHALLFISRARAHVANNTRSGRHCGEGTPTHCCRSSPAPMASTSLSGFAAVVAAASMRAACLIARAAARMVVAAAVGRVRWP